MKGVILAGGSGSRMRPATEAYAKSAALVYDRPMIHYPLTTLREWGCDTAVIVGSPSGTGDFAKMLKSGVDYGLDIEYKVQDEPGGVAQALARVENSVDGVFPLVLGDVYHDPAPPKQDEATLFWVSPERYPNVDQHSTWYPEIGIFEKPRLVKIGRGAIISYFYDERVFDFIKKMKPAHATNELEIVDIHNFYRGEGAQMVEYTGWFGDMGTPEGLLRVANHIGERAILQAASE